MTIMFTSIMGPDRATRSNTFEICAGRLVLIKDLKWIIANWRHRYQAFLKLLNADELQHDQESIHVRFQNHCDGCDITIAKAISVWQCLCWSQAQLFFFFITRSMRRVLEQETWESHKRTRLSTLQTRMTWTWCFKLMMFLSRFRPNPPIYILCHFASTQISFCRTCNRLTLRMQDVLPFPFLKSWTWKVRYRHQEAFVPSTDFQFDAKLRLQSSWQGWFLNRPCNHSHVSFITAISKKFKPEEETAKR